MPDNDSAKPRKRTSEAHDGGRPSIASLEGESGAALRASFNDPLPRAATNEAEEQSPSRRPSDLDAGMADAR